MGGREKTEDRRQDREEGFPMNRDVRFTATSLRHRSPPILLDVYYTSYEVGCQVNFDHGFARIFTDLVATENTDGTEGGQTMDERTRDGGGRTTGDRRQKTDDSERMTDGVFGGKEGS
jgi:hypothetical protein